MIIIMTIIKLQSWLLFVYLWHDVANLKVTKLFYKTKKGTLLCLHYTAQQGEFQIPLNLVVPSQL